jgi:hypothetical protein
LSDTRLRDIYNKFGEAGIEEDKTSAQGGQWALMAVFYVIWVVVSFLLSMGKQNTQARVWVYTGLVALGSERRAAPRRTRTHARTGAGAGASEAKRAPRGLGAQPRAQEAPL